MKKIPNKINLSNLKYLGDKKNNHLKIQIQSSRQPKRCPLSSPKHRPKQRILLTSSMVGNQPKRYNQRRRICSETFLHFFDVKLHDSDLKKYISVNVFRSFRSFLGLISTVALLALRFNDMKRTNKLLIHIKHCSPVLKHPTIIGG